MSSRIRKKRAISAFGRRRFGLRNLGLSVLAGAMLVGLGATPVGAQASLHEYVAPDPNEDLRLRTYAPGGNLPAVLNTPSGVVRAPSGSRPPGGTSEAYSSTQAPEKSRYIADRDTRRPESVSYRDPFSPAVTPFKRLSVFDKVLPDFSLAVRRPKLEELPTNTPPRTGHDSFYGDMEIDIVPGRATRIPSVAAGMIVRSMETIPVAPITLWKDQADNYFAKGQTGGRYRILLHVSAPRDAFGGQLRPGRWPRIPVAALPANVRREARKVLEVIGISGRMRFEEALRRLVRYFRGFAETPAPISTGDNIYTDLALSKKGVCRHRAYAFLITALALRIPARMVVNEAHAWVEVYTGELFQRIDLGGAATRLREPADPSRVSHTPPEDPFEWPPGSRSAGQSIANNGSGSSNGAAGSAGGATTDNGSGLGNEPTPDWALDNDLPLSDVVLNPFSNRLKRNATLAISGKVSSKGQACERVRLDVSLRPRIDTPTGSEFGQEVVLGSLTSDSKGRFAGKVVVPYTLRVGAHELTVATPGNRECGPGRSN